MTVEELIEIYEAAVTKRYTEWVNAPEDDNISNDMLKRAGVIAIVRALRSELAIAHNEGGFMMATTKQCNGPAYADWRINSRPPHANRSTDGRHEVPATRHPV